MRKTVLFYPCEPLHSIDERVLCHNGSLDSKALQAVPPTESEQMPFHLTIYIGDEDNPNFAGNEDVDTIARTIVQAQGSSGENREYLYKLAAAMRFIAPNVHDEHLFDLERAVKELEETENINVIERIRNGQNN